MSLPHPNYLSSIEDLNALYLNKPLLRTSIDLATLPQVKFPGNTEDPSDLGLDAAPKEDPLNVTGDEDTGVDVDGDFGSPDHERIKDEGALLSPQAQDLPAEQEESGDVHLPAAGISQQESSFLSAL